MARDRVQHYLKRWQQMVHRGGMFNVGLDGMFVKCDVEVGRPGMIVSMWRGQRQGFDGQVPRVQEWHG